MPAYGTGSESRVSTFGDPGCGTTTKSLIDSILEANSGDAQRRMEGLVIGWLTALEEGGVARVNAPDVSREVLSARSLCPLRQEQVGTQCALMFEQGALDRAVILGFLQHPVHVPSPLPPVSSGEVVIDGRRLVFEAQDEVVLTCGKASITLTRAGKVLINGAYLSSQSSGVNRIKGGSVQVN